MLPTSYRSSGPGIYYVAETYTQEVNYKTSTRYISDNLHYSRLSTVYATEKYTIFLPEDFYIHSMLQRHAQNKTTVRFLHGIFYVKQAHTQEVNQKASTFNNIYPHSGWINCHLVFCGKCYRTCVCGVSALTNSVPRDSATQETIFSQSALQLCIVFVNYSVVFNMLCNIRQSMHNTVLYTSDIKP